MNCAVKHIEANFRQFGRKRIFDFKDEGVDKCGKFFIVFRFVNFL